MFNTESVLKKTVIILLFIAIALFFIVKVTPATTGTDIHSKSIEQIDKEIQTVLKLTAGATGASAAISLLPDDQCTPIAEQFAQLGQYFLVVLSALYLEKYLISMMGYVSFSFLIPAACLAVVIGIVLKKNRLKEFAVKIGIAALLIYLAIPVSVKTSEIIYQSYENTIEDTITSANRISVENEDATGIEKFLSWIGEAAGTIVDYVTGLLSRFIEAIAVMLVTSCIIPVLVIIFFGWLIKAIFNTSFSVSDIDRFIEEKL